MNMMRPLDPSIALKALMFVAATVLLALPVGGGAARVAGGAVFWTGGAVDCWV